MAMFWVVFVSYIICGAVCLSVSYSVDRELDWPKIKEALFWPILVAVVLYEEMRR